MIMPTISNSHWWGFASLPKDTDLPTHHIIYDDGTHFDDPMTLVCQIDCAEYHRNHSDEEVLQLLPHEGMLYFFAYLDYFFGELDADCPGLAPWSSDYFRVLYSPTSEDLHTHRIVDEDGKDYCRAPHWYPSDRVLFTQPRAFTDEVECEYPNHLCLLQLDSLDFNDLNFFDCGVLFFMITPEDLKAKRFDNTKCQLYSY